MRRDAFDRGTSPRDAVDGIVGQWRRERPDLDPTAKEITGRIIRLASLFQATYGEEFARVGLSDGDYGVLATLRRAGSPFELTPTELARHRRMTSGGMTAVIDRLERKRLVERAPNPADRRGSLVRLTADGVDIVDQAMAVHTEAEHDLVDVLDDDQRAELTALLRGLLISIDGSRSGPV